MSARTDVSSLAEFQLDPASVQLLGYGFARRKQVVVLGVVDPQSDAAVCVGMIDPTDGHLLRHLGEFLGRTIMPVRLSEYDIGKALDQGYGRWSQTQEHESMLVWSPPEGADVDAEHPLQRVLDELLHRAVAAGADAIHVESMSHRVRARLRVDGRLREVAVGLQPDTAAAFVTRLRALCESSKDGHRLPVAWQDGERLRPIDAVVDTAPSTTGEHLLIRMRPGVQPLRSIDELGLLPDQLAAVQALMRETMGLVVVAGPRRSGLSTTLSAMLGLVAADPSVRVVSVATEAQPEIDGVTQHVVPADELAPRLRSLARRDADVIAVSGLVDAASSQVAVQCAHAGQLVLAGLEASEPGAAIARLRSFADGDALLADAVLGVVAQRLVRRLCPHCTEPVSPDASQESLFASLGRRVELKRGRGCEACDHTGFAGRLGLFEVMAIDPPLARAIARGEPAHELRDRARSMTSFVDAGLSRLQRGETTLDELLRVTPSRQWAAHVPTRS